MFIFCKKFRLFSCRKNNFFKNNINRISFEEIDILWNKNFLHYSRIGYIITKKMINKSYKRNNIKRLIKEYFRLSYMNFYNIDFVVIVNKNILKLNNKCIVNLLSKGFEKILSYN